VSSRPLVATVATFLVLLAGCSTTTGGSPSAGNDPTNPTTAESTEETPSSEPSESGGLAEVQPCELLDSGEAAQLQLTGGNEVKVGSARTCEYRHEGATLNESFSVAIGLQDDKGLDELNAPTIEPLNLGSHEAVSFVDSTGTCGVAIAVGDTSRVETSALGGDKEQACAAASQVATIIEPKLP
jgi:hypothetical protein